MSENTNPYPRLISWEVTNFMSIKHGKCEFDEKGIINLKGYNDSGKSAMLTALKVLLTNCNPSKQVEFIHDGEEYFRVLAVFEQGYMILRDKYINGQSLYELYKDGNVLYTTKQSNGALAKVNGVPEPIANFLGLISYGDNCLNARACFEKQIGVQTTGSENYTMFNTVLKSEEIASAHAMINNDKNKLVADMNSLDSEINATKNLMGVGKYISEEIIDYLKSHDAELDSLERCEESQRHICDIQGTINSITVNPEMKLVDDSMLAMLSDILNLQHQISNLKLTPEIDIVSTSELEEIENIISLYRDLSAIKVAPELKSLDDNHLNTLGVVADMFTRLKEYDSIIKELDNQIEINGSELAKLESEMSTLGINFVKCPGCGQIFNPDEAHIH